MRRYSLLLAAFAAFVLGALVGPVRVASALTDGYDSIRLAFQSAGGVYTTALPTLANGEHNEFHIDGAARLITQANGAAADGASVAGNPVLSGFSDGTLAHAGKSDAFGNLQVLPPVSTYWTAANVTFTANQPAPATVAAATGQKHVITGYKVVPVSDGTGGADQFSFVIKDGSTPIYTDRGSQAAGANAVGTPITNPPGFFLVGSAATAMTGLATATTATHLGMIVELQGYDTK